MKHEARSSITQDLSRQPISNNGRLSVPITADGDIVTARQQGRALAERLGFASGEATHIATAISEVARNIIKFAARGEIVLSILYRNQQCGIQVTAADEGPGIPDIPLAMQDGFSTAKGLGMGLPGCRRLMDEFEIESAVGKGTTVIMRKWVPDHGENSR